MTKEVVVVLSHLPWNFPTDYIKQTSLELAKRAKVVIFPPLDFPTLRQIIFASDIREAWLCLFKQKEITYFPTLAFIPFRRIDLINRLNVYFNLALFYLFYKIKLGGQKPIFWAFSYRMARIANFLKGRGLLIYDRVDQAGSLDPKDVRARKQEDRQLLRAADYVFVNSPYSLRYVKKYNKVSFLVPCGCAINLFKKKKINIPREIKRIKKPIIGMIGSLDHRLDFEILYSLAKKRKEWSFILVGSPFSEEFEQFKISDLKLWLKKLKKLPNFYLLGQKPKEQLANFIAGFDIGLIPYDLSQEFVKGCNPMKLYEYLAVGKPVVSVPIDSVKRYSPTVKIASNTKGFEKAIEAFLKKSYNRKEAGKREKIALKNSWEEKVKKIWQRAQ